MHDHHDLFVIIFQSSQERGKTTPEDDTFDNDIEIASSKVVNEPGLFG